jgi:hypothetical protein
LPEYVTEFLPFRLSNPIKTASPSHLIFDTNGLDCHHTAIEKDSIVVGSAGQTAILMANCDGASLPDWHLKTAKYLTCMFS